MKPFLLLAFLCLSCWASDAETLTLVDGRKLTGVYNEDTQVLDMGAAKITVPKEQIKWRDKAEVAEAPQKPTPKAAASQKPTADDAAQAIADYAAAQDKAAKIEAEAAKIRSDASEVMVGKLLDIAEGLDLRGVVFKMPADPRVSDQDFGQQVRALNDLLASVRNDLAARRLTAYLRSLPEEYGGPRIKNLVWRGSDGGHSSVYRFFATASIMATYKSTRTGQALEDLGPDPLVREKQAYEDWIKRREAHAVHHK